MLSTQVAAGSAPKLQAPDQKYTGKGPNVTFRAAVFPGPPRCHIGQGG